MKLERIKTAILIFLVLISVILTTRIWLDLTTPGIFIMFKNRNIKKVQNTNNEFDNTSLIKPEKMIINNNGKHTLIFNDRDKSTIYNRITEEAISLIKNMLSSKNTVYRETLAYEFLNKLRSGSNVEVIFPFSYDIKLLSGLLGLDKTEQKDVKNIDSIIISFDNNLFYITDKNLESIHKYSFFEPKSNMKFLLDLVNKSQTYSYVFLNEIDPEKYSLDVLIPVYSSVFGLPKLTAKNEVDGNSKNIAADFFGIDVSSLRSIVETDGTVVYTDGSEKGMKIQKDGFIEYINYSSSLRPQKLVLSTYDMVNMATDFINKHIGFPNDAYISSVESTKDEQCIIRYDYRHEGILIINDNPELNNPMEIEISDGKVKSFKRLIRHIDEADEIKNIKNPLDIIDILYKRLSEKNIDLDEVEIMDIYLSYLGYGHEDNIYMLPVWVLHVAANEGREGKFMMNAESGVILSEPY
ncbi:MAG: hypothetical protein GX154_06085 [Clostridiales bacterium]|nr:hypothetical protein [Clostridiales bacterium]